jgi:AAA+ superfamily predicted ATPase
MSDDTNLSKLIDAARRMLSEPAKPFRSDAELLEFAWAFCELRAAAPTHGRELRRTAALMAARLHERIESSGRGRVLGLPALFRRCRLNRAEREVALMVALKELGMATFGPCAEMLAASAGGVAERLRMARALDSEGRLIREGLIEIETFGPFGDQPRAAIALKSALIDRDERATLTVRGQDEMLDRTHPLFAALRERKTAIETARHFAHRGDLDRCNQQVRRAASVMWRTLDRNRQLPLWRLRRVRFDDAEAHIVILLIGKELGFAEPGDDLFSGDGLAQSASESIPQIRHALKLLGGRARLRAEGYVRVCHGRAGGPAREDDATLGSCEFELSPAALERFGVPARRIHAARNRGQRPIVRLNQLVLGDGARRAIEMALVQMRSGPLLFDEWGLGERFSYGRGVTMLFAGPPGVGKTAAAEALAYELGRPIIRANYAELENCWVGETEKNIARIFADAAASGAVLFFDEADALFYSREGAIHSWETRAVNVLLGEIEKFEGVCVLATNRKLALDAALERRITIKVEFERPTAAMRKRIWRKLLPRRVSLARDVDIDRLAAIDLSGGDIHNVILNAARIAAGRTPPGPISARDFDEAIALETGARWSAASARPIGFETPQAIRRGCGPRS